MGRKAKVSKRKILIMAVTADEYETPLVTGDTYREVGEKIGMDASGVFRMATRGNVSQLCKINGQPFKVVTVEIDDDDEISDEVSTE